MNATKIMVCMRCGREVALSQVFCKECLADMEKHPVKPGTPLQLPVHTVSQSKRLNYRKPPKPEEVIARQKKTIRRLRISLAVVLVIFGLLLGFLAFALYERKEVFLPGQNYSTAGTTEST